MDLGLQGRHALVTGGSRGIGRAAVFTLAEEGCTVSFCARDAARVESVQSELRAAGHDVHGTAADVTDASALTGWIEAAARRADGIDILVTNVSALATQPGTSSWQAGFDTDLMGTVRSVDTALPYLERSDAAAIVIVSSTAALEIYAGQRPYNAVKAALTAYSGGLAQQHAPAGIRVNTVSPGAVYHDGGSWKRYERERPEAFADMLARNPLGRLGRPEEIASAIAFVASPRASFMTGSNVVVDGGLTKRIQY